MSAIPGHGQASPPGSVQPSPSMAALLATLAQQRAGQPLRYELPFPEARRQLLREREPWLDGEPPGVVVTQRSMEVASDAATGMEGRANRCIPVQEVCPEQVDHSRALVYFHGGGWCVGSPRTHESIVRRLAHTLGCTAWSVDYALAPEHPFPAGMLDCVAVVDQLARLLPKRQLVLAGDSAGANLALSTAMWLRDRSRSGTVGQPVRLAALLLFYGVYTDALADPSMKAFGDGRFGLSIQAHERYLQAYAAPAPGAARSAGQPDRTHAFPLAPLADLSGLPPAFLLAAQLDILRDQNLQLAAALRSRGGAVELLEIPGVIHGFLAYGKVLPQVKMAIDAAGAFARRHAPGGRNDRH